VFLEDPVYVPTPQVLELNAEIKRVNRLRLKGSLVAGLAFLLVFLFTDRDAPSVRAVELCGGVLISAALGIRLWALGSIDGNKKRVLVTWGPYRYVRHPLYSGSMLFALGTCLVLGSLTAALLLFLFLFWFYLPSLHTEEQFLAARFGAEWDAYRRQTGMLLPRMGKRVPRVEQCFHLRRPLREIGTLLLLPLITFGTAALIHYLDRRYDLPDWFF
jgi:protein-S-isoprenylcysteine O-methyltransferase Ste14